MIGEVTGGEERTKIEDLMDELDLIIVPEVPSSLHPWLPNLTSLFAPTVRSTTRLLCTVGRLPSPNIIIYVDRSS